MSVQAGLVGKGLAQMGLAMTACDTGFSHGVLFALIVTELNEAAIWSKYLCNRSDFASVQSIVRSRRTISRQLRQHSLMHDQVSAREIRQLHFTL